MSEMKGNISEAEMKAYLSGSMTDAEKEAFTEKMGDDAMNWDILEGMAAMGVDHLQHSANEVNRRFTGTLEKNRRKLRRERMNKMPVFWQVALAILFLIFIAFIVVWIVKQ